MQKVGLQAVFNIASFSRNANIYIKTINQVNNTTNNVASGLGFFGRTVSTMVGNTLSYVATRVIPDLMRRIGDFGRETIRVGKDFQDQMAILATSVDDPTISLGTLREVALAVGNDTQILGADARDAAQAMTLLYKGGLTTTEVLGDMQGYLAGTTELSGGLRAVFDLVAASELSIEQASDTAVVALSTFGAELEEGAERAEFIEQSFDLFVRTANASVSEVDNIIESLRYVGPAARTMGLEIEDVTNALALMSNAGLQGSMAGTSLNAMLTDLTETTKKSEAEMKNLGITLYDDATDSMLPLIDIVGQFEVALDGMTDRQRIDALGKIFDVRGARAMNALLEEGVTGWNEMGQAIYDATGIQEQAAVRMDTLRGKQEILSSTFETFQINLQDAFDDALKSSLVILNDLIQRVGPPVIDVMTKIGTALQAILTIASDSGALDTLRAALKAMGEGDFMETFVQLQSFLTATFGEETGNAILSNVFEPLQEIVAFGPRILELFQRLGEGDFGALQGLGFIFDEIFDTDIGTKIANIVKPIGEFVQTVQEKFSQFREKAEPFFEFFRRSDKRASEFEQRVRPIVVGALAAIGAIVQTLKPIFDAFVATIRDVVVPQLTDAFGRLKEMFATSGASVEGVFRTIATVVVVAIGTILAIISGLVTGAASAFAAIVAGVQQLQLAWENLRNYFSSAIAALKALLQRDFAGAWQNAKTAVVALVTSMGQLVLGLFTSLVGGVTALIAGFVNGIIEFFTNLYQQIVGGSIIPDMVNGIIDWFGTLIEEGVALITDFVDGIVEKVQELPKKFVELLGDVIESIRGMASDFFSVGGDLIDGLKEGIKAKIQGIAEAARGVVAAAIAAARGVADANSPSRVFAELGEDLNAGLAMGIYGSARNPLNAIGDVVRGMANVASPAVTNTTTNQYNYNVQVNPTYANTQSEAGVYYDTVAALQAVRN